MAKTQTLSFPQGASYLIPFQCRSRGSTPANYTGWKILFVVKKNLTDGDDAALINQLIVPASDTGYNELLLNGDETYEFPVGRYYYQAVVVDATGTVGKSEVGLFVVEETTLRSNAGTYVGPNPPLNPPATAGLIFNARQPIYLDITLITSSGMSAAIYDPRHIQADVFDADNHTDGVTKKVMTAAERTKLAGIAAGATANNTDAYLLNRANHSGSQAISTITGLQAALDSKPDNATLTAHINNTSNPHVVTKSQVGLGSADNTADIAKNVLSATRLTNARTINGVSFDGTANITVADATKELILAPGTTAQYYRGDKTWQTLNKAAVGLSNADNTADIAKPISALTQAALDTKLSTVLGALKSDTYQAVYHGTNASTARPSGYSAVIWRGTVEPIYRQPGDIWITNDTMGTAVAVTNMALNPSLEFGSGSVEVRRNICPNPNFYTGLAPWAIGNGGGGSTAAIDPTYSHYGGQSAVITMGTDLVQSPDIRIVNVSGMPLGMLTNSRYTITAKVKHTGHTNGPRAPRIGLFYKQTSGGSYEFLWSDPTPTAAGEYDIVWTFTTPTTVVDAGLVLTGAVGIVGGQTWWAAIDIENIGFALPYFDGTYNTWQTNDLVASWTGTPQNSASVLTGVTPAYVTRNSSSNPVWISSDGPYHGTKFARALVVKDDGAAAYFYVNDYSRFGEGNTATHSTMVRVSRTIGVDVRYPGGINMSVPGWGSSTLRPANTWEEARVTNVELADGQRWIRPWPQSASGPSTGWVSTPLMLDIDRHFAIAGIYNGGYFDGDSPGYYWNGTIGNSTSSGAAMLMMNYLSGSGGTVAGNVVITGTINGSTILTGTGFPNGTVTAPVGAIYIDNASTNGASSWIKKTGTGNTGWRVNEGDTGWRDITSSLSNGWSASNVYIRRVNNTTEIIFNALAAGSSTGSTVYTIPAEFRPNTVMPSTRGLLNTAAGPAVFYRFDVASAVVSQNYATSIPTMYGRISWHNDNASWPATLPGSAV